MSAAITHWLATVALRAGLGDAMNSGVSDVTPVEKAWPWVADFLKIPQSELAEGVGQALRLPVADLSAADPAALAFLPKDQAERLNVFPLRVSDRELVVATSDPLDFEAEREVGFLSSRRTVSEVAPPRSGFRSSGEGILTGQDQFSGDHRLGPARGGVWSGRTRS